MFADSYRFFSRTLAALFALISVLAFRPGVSAREVSLLFLGDNGHHRPAERFAQLQPVLAARGVRMTYTDRMSDVNSENLAKYDGLVVYANIDNIDPPQEQAVLDYVASGHGFIPLHCATYCFRNSDQIVALMGAQFQRHGTGVFRTELSEPEHPIMKGFEGFESWDETYVHRLHNEKDRTVLEYRVDQEGREPWSWTRHHGKGRVFYTAWGHDERTWSNPGFQNLVERGIRWAVGDDPATVPAFRSDLTFRPLAMTEKRTDVQPFEYVDVGKQIPNYPPSNRWGTQSEPLNMMQKPLEPAESLKHYVTPVGFQMELFAAEPDLGGKPIAMNWDERGRLWVCETYDYPNELQPAGEGRDRVRICEDTDGDGRADKFTVFAEKLSIPTAITIYRGGAIVQNGVETLYLKDTNGDDKADLREVLISNWSLGDTHGGVSNLRWGHDNWVWGMQGYNFSEPIINGEKQPGFRMGFFRFKLDQNDPPRVTDLEFIRSTDNNTWGIGLSEEGLVFGSTANHNPSVYMPIANRYYERVRGWAPAQLGTIADTFLFKPITDRVRQVDQHGGYTAGAGHALYTARTYPRQFWNRTAFVCGPTGHLVGLFTLQRDGADFHSTSPMNLIASDDEWSAPIAAEVGPDGNVWVLDWYNFIVQHNPTPRGFRTGKGNAYESELRDKKHGRIYRVKYGEGNGQATTPPLATASAGQLVAALRHPNMLWRLQAQRLLLERQLLGPARAEATAALVELAKDQSTDEIGLNVGAIHALWALQGLGEIRGGVGGSDASEAFRICMLNLRHPSAGVRRAALQVLPLDETPDEAIAGPSGTSPLYDSDSQVRLAALLAIADMHSPRVSFGQLIGKLALDSSFTSDRWLKDALISAAAAHAWPFLQSFTQLQAEAPAAAGEIASQVAQHVARGKPTSDQMNALITSLTKTPAALAEQIITGLANGWPKEHSVTLADTAEAALTELLDRMPASGKGQLVRLAAQWGISDFDKYARRIADDLLAIVKDENAADQARIDSARQLAELLRSDEATVTQLLDQITPQLAPDLADGMILAIAASTAPNAGEQLASRVPRLSPAARETAISVLLQRPQTTLALLAALREGTIPLGDLKLDQKQALASHPDRAIRTRATELMKSGGGLPSADRQAVLETLLPAAHQKGDPMAGQEIFKKNCAKCHMIRGEGEKIAPDLTGMAVHPKEELLGHIIDPSRSVEGNFRLYTVVTTAGRIVSGMMAAESRTAIELIDTEAKRHAIPRADIEELLSSTKSVMPDGFEKQMTKDEFANLLEFLTTKGQYVPLPLDKVATAISTKGLFTDGDNGPDRMVFREWGTQAFEKIPFQLVDPQGKTRPNIVLLNGPRGTLPPRMPKSVSLACNTPLKAIHMLSGVSGWGYPYEQAKSVTMIVRVQYADGQTEDHPLQNGVHFADYISRHDVPGSKFAFNLRGQQVRYLSVEPRRDAPVESIELVKGDDATAPIVMAVTVEPR